MRLHLLEITAFGPFSDTVAVDFDELSGAGLFLLSGATGSGKTSVLDAVCFALYGDVPGDRGSAKRLRSDQADPGVRPVVLLEATLAGRRFRIIRSPSWSRAKKRGSGTTVQQASVTVSELTDGEWVPLTSRLDEAGHLIGTLVGMNLTQFTQVAMLPQGRFQAFLRARSEDRQRLLQQLFRTGRFAQVELWLREHRVALRKDVETAHRSMADAVSRTSEAAEVALPDDWDLHDLTLPARAGEIPTWAHRLRDDARSAGDRAAVALREAAGAEATTRRRLEQARVTHERRERYDEARAERAALLTLADQHRESVIRLDNARRAAGVAPLRRVAQDSAGRLVAAERLAESAFAALGVTPDALPDLVAARADAAARVRALLPRATRMDELSADITRLEAGQAEAETELATLHARQREAPAAIAGLRARCDDASAARAAREAAGLRLAAADERVRAKQEELEVEVSLGNGRIAWQVARGAAQDLREHWLTIREARLEGMAAEIAGALAVGACCPVCGSADHPAKARPTPGAPNGDAERAALKAVDDAKATEHLRDVEVRDLEARLTRLRELVDGADLAELIQERDALAAETTRLTALADGADALVRSLAEAEEAARADAEAAQHLSARVAQVGAAIATAAAERERLAGELAAELEGSGLVRLEDLLAEHERVAAAGREALKALAALEEAERNRAEAEAALAMAATEAGFGDTQAAIAAILGPEEIRVLSETTEGHERRLATLEEVLAEPGADDDSALPPLEELEVAHADALVRVGDAQSLAAVTSTRVGRLAQLAEELTRAVDGWCPVRDDLDLTDRLAAFVEGKAPDNRLQMRLSAYVLAFRLTQVVAAANTRLARMSDRRYSLEHTGRRGAGETRGGLSLLVRDDWSGESRDPATLSGGETFVVSLALALGLADVITQEAGGAELDTLFVDEGFGSLDADTLDDVMDTLDSLRDGGRVVGVVSHVAEMRDRIPTRLTVTKSRHGSTVAVTR
ncbi:MAG TPA: SMC family ATPase [Nocardioides sp.]|nr:SMC family ATPase [Nocardioides sp.]